MQRAADPPRKATIRDVAERAGVAISTVSHVFSGTRPISEKTRVRVRQAAEELAYRANPTAQSLRTSRTGIIGLVVRPRDAIHGSVRGTETFPRLMGAVATQVLERGLSLIHVPDVLDRSATQVPMDGCIVAHPYANDAAVAELNRRHTPIVTVEEDPELHGWPWAVTLDYESVIHPLLNGLKARGARRIMLLSGTEDNAWNRRPAEIYRAWSRDNQSEVLHVELYEGEASLGAARLMSELLDHGSPPDAVVTGPSTFAAGVLQAFNQRGFQAPEHFQLAALTDSEYTRSAQPRITAVDLELEDLAVEAVNLLIKRLEQDSSVPTSSRVSPTLHWRASTRI